jgi:Kelch motif
MLKTGKILVAGGWGADLAPVIPMELFDPATRAFSPAGSMSPARFGHAAMLLPNGKVLMVAGNVYDGSPGASRCTAMVQLYDAEAATFSSLPNLAQYQCEPPALAALADGRILILGYAPDKRAPLYDPATNQLTKTGAMVKNRSGHTATLLNDGRILVAGGVTDVPYDYSATAEVYDPATGAFSAVGSMARPRAYHTADLLPNGTVLIAGGIETASSTGATFRPIAEIFDPAANTFGPGASLAHPYNNGTATRLLDGRILMVGGNSPTGPATAGNQIYDPATGIFSSTASLIIGRYAHTATLLPSGGVLIVGGDTGAGPRMAPAEIYE